MVVFFENIKLWCFVWNLVEFGVVIMLGKDVKWFVKIFLMFYFLNLGYIGCELLIFIINGFLCLGLISCFKFIFWGI